MGMAYVAVFIFLVTLSGKPAVSQQGEGVGGFVEKLGEELWQLGQLVTKYSEITTKYRSNNARVDTNDGRNLTGQIVDNVGRMLERRAQAVRCIQEKAEELISMSNREQFSIGNFSLDYVNVKYSGAPQREWMSLSTTYININFTEDRHFYSIPVNKMYSAVHIPTNLYDRYPQVAEAITWSAGLNETFVKNYLSDPEMGWQYYGASTGMMRQYPAVKWHLTDADLYDCRARPWYIEAATCSKDVVILMDNSGSMTGMRNNIAKLVVTQLLNTFSNNDFINVLQFSWTATPVVECFQSLVQANYQNVKYLQEAVEEVKPQGNASVPNAFEAAFAMLKEARIRRGCGNASDCQQLIMFVTDGLPGNISEVFLKHNRLPDGTVPVRVFTYLLGLEVRGVDEIQNIACENRGYFVHITALDQVQDQVLKYIAVLARPLALQVEEHPPRWSHLFTDVDDPWLVHIMNNEPQRARFTAHERYVKSQYFSQQREDVLYIDDVNQVEGNMTTYKEYRMMTSVSIPVYDKRTLPANQTKFPELLAGVAGTDIPVKDLYKLTYPYKIGANGYAFILTNNGHILMHPDHRPVYERLLKDNYNSVDLSEVEFAAEKEGEQQLLELRNAMVNHQEGDVQNVMVKFHYDDMKRVGIEKRDYYFSPLPGTPFSLGLAIPADYGDYQIGVKDVVNERFLTYTSYNTHGNPLDDYFRDPEWRLHPDWTYCKYRFGSYKNFNSSEEELVDILRKIKNQFDWRQFSKKWKAESQASEDQESEKCNQPFVPEDSFFCDPDLITLLIFDAMVTLQPFQEPVHVKNPYETKLMNNYNTTLRFVATQSGLTRWQKIPKPEGNADRGNFGHVFPHAIHEPWFKAAVLQYNLDTRGEYNKDGDSFVFSVPFDAGDKEDLSIMATISIFPRDGGRKAPASVVGYQMTYDSFYNRCMELSSTYPLDCKSDSRACYIIDHNTYVILSRYREDVGRSLLLVRPDTLKVLLDEKMYYSIPITDHQALIIENECVTMGEGAASSLDRPLWFVVRILSWLWSQLLWTIFEPLGFFTFSVHGAPSSTEDEDSMSNEMDYTDEQHAVRKPSTVNDTKVENRTKILRRTSTPAIRVHTLYLLNQSAASFYTRTDNHSCLISARRIEHTNLMLLVVDLLFKDTSMQGTNSITPEELDATVCARYTRNSNLTRRGLSNCVTFHPEEEEIDACGIASLMYPNLFLLFCTLMSLLILYI